MGRKEPKLRWNGSNSAQAEYEAAVQAANRRKATRVEQEKRRTATPQATKSDYLAYLKSKRWKQMRQLKLDQVGGKCEVCGTEHELQVHHLHYRRLFREKLKDLQVLCRGCHENEHEQSGVADPITRQFLNVARSF